MANEISFCGVAGSNLYARFLREDEVWNVVNEAFEVWADATVAQYGVALVPQGNSGWYVGSVPTDIPAGALNVAIYKRAGGTQAVADMFCGGVRMSWSGIARLDLVDIAGGVGGIVNIDYEVTDIRT